MAKDRMWILISTVFSMLLLTYLISLWSGMNQFAENNNQLIDTRSVDNYLKKYMTFNRAPQSASNVEPVKKIKTGIFIQSIEIIESDKVSVSGYVWQHFPDKIKPNLYELGFYFPQQVKISTTIEPRLAYQKRQNDSQVLGWFFEVILRQPFDYSSYPFDHKIVTIQIRPKDKVQEPILVPDLESYQETREVDIFGIESDIVMSDWHIDSTYFTYQLQSYETNFGNYDLSMLDVYPELSFNLVIKRKFENAFIYNLLPILLVVILLYGALLSVSDKKVDSKVHGFSPSSVLGICISLLALFVAMQLQLRQSLQNPSTLMYIEYFYILIYLLLVLVATNALFISKKWTYFLHCNNSLLLKTMYWPFVLTYFVIITQIMV